LVTSTTAELTPFFVMVTDFDSGSVPVCSCGVRLPAAHETNWPASNPTAMTAPTLTSKEELKKLQNRIVAAPQI
jgi:hypothetical protein